MRSQLLMRAKVTALRVAAPLLEPIYGGVASILALHRVRPAPSFERVGFPRWIECTPAELERTLALFQRRGYTFVSLDELCDRLKRGYSRRAAKVAVITLDDGYLDNYRVAAPMFAASNIPYTIYVATGFPDRTVAPWASLLEETLATGTTVSFEHAGESLKFATGTRGEREHAFEKIAALFANEPPARTMLLSHSLFGAAETACAIEAHHVTWDHLRELSASGLATIGAHTEDHVPLPSLSDEKAREQIQNSKARIERELGLPVRHFAYPFGACGPREGALVRELGFVSAVTTRVANVFPEHRDHLFALPRVYTVFESLAEGRDKALFRDEIALQIRGASPALANRGRRVVTFGHA